MNITVDATDAGLAVIIFGLVNQIRKWAPKIDGLWVVGVVSVIALVICIGLNSHAVIQGLIQAVKVIALALGAGELAGYHATKVAEESVKLNKGG